MNKIPESKISRLANSLPVRIGSAAITVASLLFFGWKMYTELPFGELDLFTAPSLLAYTGYSIIYSIVIAIPALAWTLYLRPSNPDENRFSAVGIATIYGKTQLAKYLPGNVFHFVTRHVDSVSRGAGQIDLVKASVFEMSGLLFSGSLLSTIGLVFVDYPITWLRVAIIALSAILIVFAALHYIRSKTWSDAAEPDFHLKGLTILPLYILFFASTGLLLILMHHIEFGNATSQKYAILFFSVIVSWIAGYVTPGSPGGLGVREAAMLVMLEPAITEQLALELILGYRIVTTMGDLLLFLYSSLIEWAVKR